jgi:hypothetical protein
VLGARSTLIRFGNSLLVVNQHWMLNVALALPVLGARSTLIRFGNSLLVVNQQAVASMVRFSKERPWSRPTYTGRASATFSIQCWLTTSKLLPKRINVERAPNTGRASATNSVVFATRSDQG